MLYAISMIVFYFSILRFVAFITNIKVIKYFRLIAIMNLVYIIVFTLHIFNFEGGSKSANGGQYLLVDLDLRGSISTSRSIWTRGSKSTSGYGPGVQIYGVQINWDTGVHGYTLRVASETSYSPEYITSNTHTKIS
jgi:hypothetical protein